MIRDHIQFNATVFIEARGRDCWFSFNAKTRPGLGTSADGGAWFVAVVADHTDRKEYRTDAPLEKMLDEYNEWLLEVSGT